MRRRIGVVTGTRAEYGLLRPLCTAINADPSCELVLMVTGMHLSPEFGMTVREIEEDGLPIAAQVEMLLSSDTPAGIAKSMALGLIGFADALAGLHPHLLVVLGDRFEVLSASTAAMLARIPIAHIHGGEASEGAIDESIRHALTKLAHLHFPATETYRQRILQMGEDPARVFNFGAPVLDTIHRFSPISPRELAAILGMELAPPLVVVTFHPVTLEAGSSVAQCLAMLAALDTIPEARIVITKPNADTEGRGIIAAIDEYAAARSERVRAVVSLGHTPYLSLLSIADLVIGNSSSGLLEAPQFAVPTVDIGDRQRGRLAPASVVHCEPDQAAIVAAIGRALDSAFRLAMRSTSNPYGDGTFAPRALEVLKNVVLGEDLLKKRFHTIARSSE